MPRIRIIFEKRGLITFVNHMDLPTLFSRAARRAGLSQEFTQGFSPHPHISLASPLAIGVEGLAEPAEFWFNEWTDECGAKWSANLPEGLKILKCAEVDGPSLAKIANAAIYRFSGVKSKFDHSVEEALCAEAERSGALYASRMDGDSVVMTTGGLERCGAGNFVRALANGGFCGGWPDVCIVRETVGQWSAADEAVLPLI